MEAEDVLRTKFSEIGKEYGFDRVEAEFIAFKDFKVRWQRSYKWAEFKVSDYLMDAPSEVIDDLCRSLFSRIMGSEDESYSEAMCEWVTGKDFAENKQQVYLKRSRNITRTSEGEVRDLRKSYERLIEMGLVQDDPSVFLTWTKETNIRKIGHCSVLMKVISLSKALDSDAVPEYVLDYCLYHELCHIIIGFDPTSEKHDECFAELESKYPRKSDAEVWLKKLCMYL